MSDYIPPFSEDKREMIKEFIRSNPDASLRTIASEFNVSPSTAHYYKKLLCSPSDEEALGESGVKKALEVQRLRDVQRTERGEFRKEARKLNSSNELFSEMLELIPKAKIGSSRLPPPGATGGTLVIGLSDVHFGLSISVPNNIVNTKVLSQRLYAYALAAVRMGLRVGARRCVFVLTGDMISSNRRTGEAAAVEYNRAHALLNAFEVISGMMEFVSSYIAITNVISVLGNESRVDEDLELNHKCFYENFDWVLDRMLKALYNGSIKFSEFTNPVEKLIDIDGVNILLAHGLVKPKENPNKQLQFYRARYPELDYMIVGHIHSELVALGFSRSAGLPGANEYSTYSLGIPTSNPGQTFHLVQDGRVYSFPVDLSKVTEDHFLFTEPPKQEAIATVREKV